jgi:hypothetical protein
MKIFFFIIWHKKFIRLVTNIEYYLRIVHNALIVDHQKGLVFTYWELSWHTSSCIYSLKSKSFLTQVKVICFILLFDKNSQTGHCIKYMTCSDDWMFFFRIQKCYDRQAWRKSNQINLLKLGRAPKCSKGIMSSCSTSGNRCVILVTIWMRKGPDYDNDKSVH